MTGNNLDSEHLLHDPQTDATIPSRSFLSTGMIALAALAAGIALGYILRGVDLSATAPEDAAPADSVGSELSFPRVENVSADDDPSIGPEDAPVTIVEFSDFR